MAERAELGGLASERLRTGGSGTYLGARERIDERLAILLAWLHVSSGRPSAGQFTDDDVVAQRGCRTSPSQSARWPNVETHNHAGDDLAGLAAVCAQVGRNPGVDALPPPKDYVLALGLYYSQIVCKIRL
jgi:hypothetical protein